MERHLWQDRENDEISREWLVEASSALSALEKRIRWKPGKGEKHLEKRRAMGHLPQSFSLEDYNALISKLIADEANMVYLYTFGTERYYAVRGKLRQVDWIVIFGKDGIMETAFPPQDIDGYIERRGFRPLGELGVVVRWKREKDC